MLKISGYQNVNLPEKVQRPVTPTRNANDSGKAGAVDFKSTLNQVLDKSANVHFSAHAKARLHSRGVDLSDAKLEALSKAIDKADAKGARESLILSDEAAYVVSVKNRTIITAFDRDNLRDGVFTSIDSAVVL
jgi:flagellar operon protein